MKGTMTIRGATIDLKDTQIAKLQDIERLLDHLDAQDSILTSQPTNEHHGEILAILAAQPVTEQVVKIYTLLFKIIDQNRAVMALLNRDSLWARIKRRATILFNSIFKRRTN